MVLHGSDTLFVPTDDLNEMKDQIAPFQREPLKGIPTAQQGQDRMDALRRALGVILDNVAILASGILHGINKGEDISMVIEFVRYLKNLWEHVQQCQQGES